MFQILGNCCVFLLLIVLQLSGIKGYSDSEAYKNFTNRLYKPYECVRECVEGEPARVCYYNFTLESYAVLSRACDFCSPGPENTFYANCECVWADGVERMLYTANRMLPGPSIQVCQYDKVVIDVRNDIPANEVTLHWHGIKQNGTQYYDGVPMVTQCPINEGDTFRYTWIARDRGTQFWHSHTGLQKMNGLYGSIIIREPKSRDIHGRLYDFDLPAHVLLISDWFRLLAEDKMPGPVHFMPGQFATNFLINGKGRYTFPETNMTTNTSLETFVVTSGKRYRFRLINSQSTVCPTQLTIEGHTLTIIATDGEPVLPVEANSIISLTGERYDFILNANQSEKSYWIQLRGLQECGLLRTQQLGILRYEGSNLTSISATPAYDLGLPNGIFLNALDGECNVTRPNAICINQLKSAVGGENPNQKPDLQIVMPFRVINYEEQKLFDPVEPYKIFIVANDRTHVGSLTDNITYAAPPSPLISQFNDDLSVICNKTNRPAKCSNTTQCTCTHVEKIPYNALVELVLIDALYQANLTHPFHLHGMSFSVLAIGNAESLNVSRLTGEAFQKADAEGKIKRQLSAPPYKDTLTVPAGGYIVIRFRANNPGVWFFHCHFLYHTAIGMVVVFQVGEPSDLPPVPPNFPKCGDHKPFIYADPALTWY